MSEELAPVPPCEQEGHSQRASSRDRESALLRCLDCRRAWIINLDGTWEPAD